jgi:hypothetical protein
MAEPQMKVPSGDMPPDDAAGAGAKRSFMTSGPSPARKMTGARVNMARRLEYHANARALPPTTSRLFLITTEWTAVIIEDATPKPIPAMETGVPSRKTPTKKPAVTRPQARRTLTDGRECKYTSEVMTVKGRTMPRATW